MWRERTEKHTNKFSLKAKHKQESDWRPHSKSWIRVQLEPENINFQNGNWSANNPSAKQHAPTEERYIPNGYRTVFGKLLIRCGFMGLRPRLLDILHMGHSGITTMTSVAKIFWWPDMKQDIENKVKDCTACLASGKNLKYRINIMEI